MSALIKVKFYNIVDWFFLRSQVTFSLKNIFLLIFAIFQRRWNPCQASLTGTQGHPLTKSFKKLELLIS